MSKTLFIISPIGKEGTQEFKHWDKVRRHLIEKVAKEKGYKTIRADDISEPGKITSQIIEYLIKSDLVVADLSTKNPNVFYELAIRDAARLSVILIGDYDVEIPFDVRAQRLLKYSMDLDEIEDSRKKLSEYIDAVEKDDFKVDSPVTEALLTPSDKISTSNQEYLSLILQKLNSLGTEIRRTQGAELPRIRRTSTSFEDVLDISEILTIMGVDIIERKPEEIPEFKDITGIAVNRQIFLSFINQNLGEGVKWVNYDPDFDKYWLWLKGNMTAFYYWDESI